MRRDSSDGLAEHRWCSAFCFRASDAPLGQTEARDERSSPHIMRNRLRIAIDPARVLRGARHGVARWLHPTTEAQRNERVLYANVGFGAFSAGGAMGFVSVFMVRLGAPNWLVGLLSSLPALVMALSVLPVGAYLQRRRNTVRIVNLGQIGFRGLIGALALLPFVPATVAPFLLVALRSMAAVPQVAMNVGMTTLLGRAIAPRERARVISTRMAIHRLIMAAAGYAAGQWLDAVVYPLNYQVLFATALLAGVGGALVLARMRMPVLPEAQVRASRKIQVGLKDIIPLLKRERAFRNYMFATVAFRIGAFMPMALFPIYRVRDLGSSDAWIGTIFTVQRVLQMTVFLALGPLLRRKRVRQMLWLSCLGMGLFPLTTALATTPEMLLIPAVAAGLMGPGMTVFLSDTLMRVSPEDQRPLFAALNTFTATTLQFIMPLLGTLLADGIGIRTMLVVAAVARMAGALLFWRLGVGGSARSEQERRPSAQATAR